MKWRPIKYIKYSILSLKLCLEVRDGEYIILCIFIVIIIIFGRIMSGFELIEGDWRRACTQEPFKKVDFNPYPSPAPHSFHCNTLFEVKSSPPL